MICIDNAKWMRNGDFSQNRFCQTPLISSVAPRLSRIQRTRLGTMVGKGMRVLVTPTSDLGKILVFMHGLEIGREMKQAEAIQLALKHRQNKKQKQRIIVFAGSPVNHDKKQLEMNGRKLKKNSIALDIVDFGEETNEKPKKLEALLADVNNKYAVQMHFPMF